MCSQTHRIDDTDRVWPAVSYRGLSGHCDLTARLWAQFFRPQLALTKRG